MPSLPIEDVRWRDGFEVPWPQSLEDFGAALAAGMRLPDFEYDSENVYEWGQTLAENGLVEVNISREHGWEDAPGEDAPGESISVTLMVSKNAPVEWDEQWVNDYLLPHYKQAVDAFKTMQQIARLHGEDATKHPLRGAES